MEDAIGIFFYDSFIELPGSNQTFGESKDVFNPPPPRARRAGRKEHAT